MKHIAGLLIILLFFSCGNNSGCAKSVHVKMRNLTGLDGCSWVLQLDNESYLEATNLSEFDVDFIEGKDLHVTYKEIDGGSICMVGKIVEIKCLSED